MRNDTSISAEIQTMLTDVIARLHREYMILKAGMDISKQLNESEKDYSDRMHMQAEAAALMLGPTQVSELHRRAGAAAMQIGTVMWLAGSSDEEGGDGEAAADH